MENFKIPKPKILITGGLWYIWSHATVVFMQAGYDVIIIDNLSNSYMDVLWNIEEVVWSKPEFLDIDIRDHEALNKLFKSNSNIDGVIHFAGLKSVWDSCDNPFEYYENNIIWTINILHAMKANNIKNFIFSSSATVYDAMHLLPPFAENDRLNTSNPYGTTKLVNEYIIKDMAHFQVFNAINLRYFNPIWAHHSGLLGENPQGTPTNLLPYIMKVATGEYENLRIWGDDYKTDDGTGVRDYIHVMDLAEAHLLAYEYIKEFEKYNRQKEESNKWLYDVFNIWTGNGTSVKQMVDLVEKVTEKNIPTKVMWRRDGDVDTSICNPQKAKQVIGWSSKRTIYQAVEDTWRYINKQRN